MIRLIQRRLIIPQGDTGEFTIPTQGTVSNGDVAILAIYDNLTHTTVLEKQIEATQETLTFKFESGDTAALEPNDSDYYYSNSKRYSWDITIMRDPTINQEGKTEYGSIDSYYAAFDLPPCIIKKVTRNVQK